MPFSIAFNLVSKFPSWPVAAIDIAGAGFLLTVSDAEEISVLVIVQGEVKVTRISLLVVVIGIVAWLFIGGKMSVIMSFINYRIKVLLISFEEDRPDC